MQIQALLGVLRRRWIPITACLLAGVVAALLITRDQPKLYRATETLLVNIPEANNPGEALQGVQVSTQLLASYAEVATSRTAASKIRELLALPDSVDSVEGKLGATPVADTLLIHISATDGDPVRAASLAHAASQVFIDAVASLEAGKRNKVTPSVVDPAVAPTSPVSPRPKLNLSLGALLGILLATALALLLEALDRTVKGPSQLAELCRSPILGIVPKLNALSRTPAGIMQNTLTPAAESYRALRTAIRFIDPDHPLQTILVTSAGPGEGKSTTAANFAVSLALGGERVVLVDADLRRGTLLELFGTPSGAGVTSLVTGAAELQEVMYEWHDLLELIGTGPLPPNPAEILGSQAMANMLESLRGYAEVIVIDSPPVLPVTDAVALSTQVDGVLLVARDSETHRNSIVEATRRLEGVGAKVVGCVLNAAKVGSDLYADYAYLAPEVRSARGRLSARLRRSG